MKRLFVLMMTMWVVACGDGGGGGGGTAVGTTPVQGDARCISSSTLCNNGVYGQYSGWMPYNFPHGGTNYDYTTYFQNNGVCGCQYGYAPAYNSVMGMGCYRIQNGYNWNISYAFTYNNAMNNWMAAPQSSYNFQQISAMPNGNGANCTNRIATSCLIDQANSCASGSYCQQTVSGSNLGICVGGGYNNNYPTYPTGYPTSYPGTYYPGTYGYPGTYYPGAGVGFGIGFGAGFRF